MVEQIGVSYERRSELSRLDILGSMQFRGLVNEVDAKVMCVRLQTGMESKSRVTRQATRFPSRLIQSVDA